MKESDNILQKAGTENPFKVPDGYFEQFTSDLMNKLPEKKQTELPQKPLTLWTRFKPLLYMAAMFAGAALLINVGQFVQHKRQAEDHVSAYTSSQSGSSVKNNEATISDEYINAAINATMMDDYSLYVYLNE